MTKESKKSKLFEMKKNSLILFLLFVGMAISCSENPVMPKPKAQLSLNYPEAKYKKVELDNFSFEQSDRANLEKVDQKAYNLSYPRMKAKIYITYSDVNRDLDTLLRDAEKFTFEHTIKADEIFSNDFVNESEKIYGTINSITGNVASQIQFHVTDSTKHFISGSLYFYAQPNYDSIMPAIKYLKKDVVHILETLRWIN